LQGHDKAITSVKFSPDGNYLASGSYDSTIKLWSVKSQKEVATMTGHIKYVTSIAFSPDGKYLASGSVGKLLKLWDVESHKEVANLPGLSS
jgi:WD40 repeat protein